MKVHYDEASDAIYIRFDDTPVVESEEVRPGVVLDFGDEDRIVGIEILRAREHISADQLKKMDFEVA